MRDDWMLRGLVSGLVAFTWKSGGIPREGDGTTIRKRHVRAETPGVILLLISSTVEWFFMC